MNIYVGENFRTLRYIRNSLNWSNVNNHSHRTQIEAYSSWVNVALNKTVTQIYWTKDPGNDTPLSRITNWTIATSPYYDIMTSWQIQVDLGQTYLIESITMWHYYWDGRIYNDNVLEISSDWTNWETVFNSSVDGTYSETSAWKTVYLSTEVKDIYIGNWLN